MHGHGLHGAAVSCPRSLLLLGLLLRQLVHEIMAAAHIAGRCSSGSTEVTCLAAQVEGPTLLVDRKIGIAVICGRFLRVYDGLQLAHSGIQRGLAALRAEESGAGGTARGQWVKAGRCLLAWAAARGTLTLCTLASCRPELVQRQADAAGPVG